MKHLKPVQVLTNDAIFLLERVKMNLDMRNEQFKTAATTELLREFDELLKDLKE